jgi:hypothetical protein
VLASQEQYVSDFWRRSDVQVKDVREERTKRTTVEVQQAIRFNLFHILQAAARAEDAGVPAKGLTGQAYEGHYFWDTEIYLLPFLTYTSPWIGKNLLAFRYNMLPQAQARARQFFGSCTVVAQFSLAVSGRALSSHLYKTAPEPATVGGLCRLGRGRAASRHGAAGQASATARRGPCAAEPSWISPVWGRVHPSSTRRWQAHLVRGF